MEQAQNITETLLENINQNELICRKAYLKIEGIDSFSIIFQVDSTVFYSDKADELYQKAITIRKAKNREHFNISFSFMPESSGLNESRLTSDGFVLTYERK